MYGEMISKYQLGPGADITSRAWGNTPKPGVVEGYEPGKNTSRPQILEMICVNGYL